MFFSPQITVIDIIYNPIETLFLKRAREAGCVTVNGLEDVGRTSLKGY